MRNPDIINKKRIEGTPDLVVEINRQEGSHCQTHNLCQKTIKVSLYEDLIVDVNDVFYDVD